MPQCQSNRPDGTRCRMAARKESEFCIAHDQDYAETQRANSTTGGLSSGAARRRQGLNLPTVSLTDRGSIQVLLDVVFRMEVTGQLTEKRGRNLIRLLSLAIRNAPRNPGPGSETSMQEAYAGPLREELDTAFAEALEFARGEDLQALSEEMARASGLRTSRARDLENFPVLLPSGHPAAKRPPNPADYRTPSAYLKALEEE